MSSCNTEMTIRNITDLSVEKWSKIANFFLILDCCQIIREKGRDLAQSYDKSPYTHRKIQKVTWQHKNATKNVDYTTIADRLRTVSWGNDKHPNPCHFPYILSDCTVREAQYDWIFKIISPDARFRENCKNCFSCLSDRGIPRFASAWKFFSRIFTVIHAFCTEWPACHPQGGGWQATGPVSRVKWLWRHRQTGRNGNVARLDSSIFPTFTSEKYVFGRYRRKIINIYCPLVTEKSTNPRVKWTCPCLSHHRTIEVDSINLSPRCMDDFRFIDIM